MPIDTEGEIIRRFSTTWAEKYWEKHLVRYNIADPKSGLDLFFGELLREQEGNRRVTARMHVTHSRSV
jgi:hypothetical protein